MPTPAVGSVLPSVPSPPVCKRTDQSHLPQDIPHLSFSHPYDARIPCGQFHQRPPTPHTAMGQSSADVQPALSTGKTLSLCCTDRCTTTAWTLRVLLLWSCQLLSKEPTKPAQDLLTIQKLRTKAWPSRAPKLLLQTARGPCILCLYRLYI